MKKEIEYYFKFWKSELKAFIYRLSNRIRRIPYRIKKILKYVKLAYNDWDFDYLFMLNLEQMKLKEMEKYFSRKKVKDYCEYTLRDIKICIKLLNVINQSDTSYEVKYNGNPFSPDAYYSTTRMKYVNVKNMKRFMDASFYNSTNKDCLRASLEDELRQLKAWNLYCDIRKNNMKTWWF